MAEKISLAQLACFRFLLVLVKCLILAILYQNNDFFYLCTCHLLRHFCPCSISSLAQIAASVLSLSLLCSAFSEGGLDAIYDITVGYPLDFPHSELELAMGHVPPEVHYTFKRYSRDELPLSSEEELGSWLTTLWAEKESFLENYYAGEKVFDNELHCQVSPVVERGLAVYWALFVPISLYYIWSSWLVFLYFVFANIVGIYFSFMNNEFYKLYMRPVLGSLGSEKKKDWKCVSFCFGFFSEMDLSCRIESNDLLYSFCISACTSLQQVRCCRAPYPSTLTLLIGFLFSLCSYFCMLPCLHVLKIAIDCVTLISIHWLMHPVLSKNVSCCCTRICDRHLASAAHIAFLMYKVKLWIQPVSLLAPMTCWSFLSPGIPSSFMLLSSATFSAFLFNGTLPVSILFLLLRCCVCVIDTVGWKIIFFLNVIHSISSETLVLLQTKCTLQVGSAFNFYETKFVEKLKWN